MNVSLKVKGLDEIIRNIDNADVKREFTDAANVSISEVQREAKAEVPVRTSQLQQSHRIKPAGLRLRAEVYTNKEYAVPVHEGHRLVAWGRDTGRRIPANPWMERAVRKSENNIQRAFNRALNNISKTLTR